MNLRFLFIIAVINHICFGDNSSIITWETEIRNVATNHRIPLKVHYPNTTSVNNKYPIMVFNHGGDTKNTWYDFIWQNLVPQGYIVAMPGDYEKYINDLHYAADQRYTLDYLLGNCNKNISCPLYNSIIPISMCSGHSEGGAASFFSIGNYPLGQTFKYEFDAAFTLSGCTFRQNEVENAIKNITNKSIFFMGGTHDCICQPDRNTVVFFNEVTDKNSCKYLADITNGTHCHFMEPPLSVRDVPCLTEEELICPKEYHNNLEKEKQWAIVIQYMTLFLNATLNKNYDNFQMIVNKLNNDKSNGVMTDIGNANCIK
eukprot:103874_1